jgi:alkyl hydroperoxide reductase subunit D
MSFTETKNDLLKDLNIADDASFAGLDAMAAGETKFLRDLRINLKNVLGSENLTPKEAYLLAASVAINEKNESLINSFISLAREHGADDAAIAETYACTSMLATNNILYRFRHFTKNSNEKYQSMPAAIKMNVMMSPVLGKELFELMSLVVSAVNGCETCVASHEDSLRKLGTSEVRIFDAVRLASIVKGLTVAMNAKQNELV